MTEPRNGLLWIGAIIVGVMEWLMLPWKPALLTTGLLMMGLAVLSALLRRWSIMAADSEARSMPREQPRP